MNGQKHDETVEGGRYINGSNYVNAEGEILGPVEEEEKVDEPPVVPSGFTNVQPPAEPPTIFNTPPPVVSTE